MNPIDVLLNHRTIREFKSDPMPPQQLSLLLDIAKRTATSMGMQSFSIIHIVNPELKGAIAEVCNQEYVARVPDLFIFIVDGYRNSRIARERGVESVGERDSDRFFQGWTDAAIAAQNMVAAAELSGFGTVYFGSILNNAPKMIELLKLPDIIFFTGEFLTVKGLINRHRMGRSTALAIRRNDSQPAVMGRKFSF